MNREMPYVSAVAVEDSKIVYVGNDEGAKAYESGAKVIDLAGKMLIPGMIDAHCHPNLAAFLTSGILCDAGMSKEETLETIRAYVEAHPERENYFGIGYPNRTKICLELLAEYHEKYHSEMFNVNTMKIVNDGTVDSCSCALLEPYPGGSVVEPMAQGEFLYSKCVEAASKGHDIHIHAIGDKAIRETLRAARAVREAGCFDTRITNAHTQITAAEDIPLFAKYNVLANTSSIWFYDAPEVEESIGARRYRHQFELQSILKQGARMTLGSDYPFDEMGQEPLKGIQMGVTRQLFLEKDPLVLQPAGERLSVQQCLEGYTINAAYCMHLEDKTGSLEVGKYADLVVLERDLNEIDPHEIMNVPVLLTMLNGRATFVSEAFADKFLEPVCPGRKVFL